MRLLSVSFAGVCTKFCALTTPNENALDSQRGGGNLRSVRNGRSGGGLLLFCRRARRKSLRDSKLARRVTVTDSGPCADTDIRTRISATNLLTSGFGELQVREDARNGGRFQRRRTGSRVGNREPYYGVRVVQGDASSIGDRDQAQAGGGGASSLCERGQAQGCSQDCHQVLVVD